MREDEIKSSDIDSVRNLIKALKYLNIGGTIKTKIGNLKIAELSDGGFGFCLIADSYVGATRSTRVLGIEPEVAIAAIHTDLTDEDYTMMAASIALTDFNRRK